MRGPAPGNLTRVSTSLPYAELFIAENDQATAARDRAGDLGCAPIGAGAGAALAFIAAGIAARNVVEIGTGTGVSGLHLFDGMVDGGILTSIDIESEHQRAAKQAFSDAGIAPGRARLINGRALDVLPRLTDGGYDLVLIDGDPREYPQYLVEAARLLRRGGVVVIAHALHGGRVADPTARDAETVAVRDAGRSLRDDDQWTAVLIPLGDGLLAGVKR
ncbi:MAG: methyltransferase [Actinobacteria bacterium 69-20]|nr:MAG: methyltransferase [Actinobacteria bacterium 69-20]